jgi:hypothetical protein
MPLEWGHGGPRGGIVLRPGPFEDDPSLTVPCATTHEVAARERGGRQLREGRSLRRLMCNELL